MAGNSTLARPYAKAAFDHARDKGELQYWSDMLALAAAIGSDPIVRQAYGHPAMKPSDWADLFLAVGGGEFSEAFGNFLRLVAENGRIPLIADIRDLFEQYRAEEEGKLEVRVITAVPLNDEQRDRLAKVLEKRFEKSIELECHVDPQILGGAVLHAGDFLIDGSIRGKLERMAAVLTE